MLHRIVFWLAFPVSVQRRFEKSPDSAFPFQVSGKRSCLGSLEPVQRIEHLFFLANILCQFPLPPCFLFPSHYLALLHFLLPFLALKDALAFLFPPLQWELQRKK